MNKKSEPLLTTSNIAIRLNRERSTIVKWELTGKIPLAKRNEKGTRIYTLEDFQKIKDIVTHKNFYQRKPKR